MTEECDVTKIRRSLRDKLRLVTLEHIPAGILSSASVSSRTVTEIVTSAMKVKLVHVREMNIIFSQLVLERHVQEFHKQPFAVSIRGHGPLERQIRFNGSLFNDTVPLGTGEIVKRIDSRIIDDETARNVFSRSFQRLK